MCQTILGTYIVSKSKVYHQRGYLKYLQRGRTRKRDFNEKNRKFRFFYQAYQFLQFGCHYICWLQSREFTRHKVSPMGNSMFGIRKTCILRLNRIEQITSAHQVAFSEVIKIICTFYSGVIPHDFSCAIIYLHQPVKPLRCVRCIFLVGCKDHLRFRLEKINCMKAFLETL